MNKAAIMCLYRGNAVRQIVLAGDAQQFVLCQLKATEGTRSSFLLQLRCVWTSVVWPDRQRKVEQETRESKSQTDEVKYICVEEGCQEEPEREFDKEN